MWASEGRAGSEIPAHATREGKPASEESLLGLDTPNTRLDEDVMAALAKGTAEQDGERRRDGTDRTELPTGG